MNGLLNSSRSVWIGLIVVISLGLAIEFMKTAKNSVSAATGSSRIFGFESLADSQSDTRDNTLDSKNRERADRARSRLLKGRLSDETETRLAGLSKTAPEGASDAALQAGAAAPVQTKSAVADAKKKKKKKKKKDKKSEDVAAFVNPAPPVSSNDENKKSSANDVVGGSSFSGGGTSRRQTTSRSNNVVEDPETLEEWLKFILPEPNYDRTLKLIEAQQQRSIDSEIFHEVISQMLADSRPKMHEFAVFALGSSPSLKSFLLLEEANRSEAEGSPLRLQTRSHMRAYAKLENLRVLASVISAQVDARISFEALKLVQVAVSAYRSQTSTGGGSSTGSGPSTSSVISNISRQFAPLVSVLTRFSEVTTEQSLQQEATQTLNQVRTIVGVAANAPTPGATAPSASPAVTSTKRSSARGW